MKNKFLLIIVISFVFSLLTQTKSHCSEETPENLVRDFYEWYMLETGLNKIDPINQDIIYKYVHACTIDKLHIEYKKGVIDSDYFFSR